MKVSVVSHVLLGASAASALTLPVSLLKRAQSVDLSQFTTAPTISLEEAKANVEKNNANSSSASSSTTSTGAEGNSKVADTTAASPNVNAAAAGSCTAPVTRVEWRSLADADKTAFVQAVKCLMNLPASGAFSAQGATNRYEDLVAVHYAMSDSIHNRAQFLPWHRYYVSVFESLLREECSYAGPMTWWDETLDAGNFANAPLFTSAYFGAAPVAANGQGSCVEDGMFGGITLHVGGQQCLSRGVDESATSQCNTDFVNTCNGNNVYSDMESCSEYGPHAYGHNGVGAIMSQVSISPNDPTFFLHHGFVDHSWILWQNADIAGRLYQMNGCADQNSPCTAITTDYVLSSMGLRPDTTINNVMDTQGGYLCYIYDK